MLTPIYFNVNVKSALEFTIQGLGWNERINDMSEIVNQIISEISHTF